MQLSQWAKEYLQLLQSSSEKNKLVNWLLMAVIITTVEDSSSEQMMYL